MKEMERDGEEDFFTNKLVVISGGAHFKCMCNPHPSPSEKVKAIGGPQITIRSSWGPDWRGINKDNTND